MCNFNWNRYNYTTNSIGFCFFQPNSIKPLTIEHRLTGKESRIGDGKNEE